jgi:hypothetical protein
MYAHIEIEVSSWKIILNEGILLKLKINLMFR